MFQFKNPNSLRNSMKFHGYKSITTWNKAKELVIHSCLTFCDPMDCSLLVSSTHGIFQARILEWVAIPFFRGSSRSREWIKFSWFTGKFFTVWATMEALRISDFSLNTTSSRKPSLTPQTKWVSRLLWALTSAYLWVVLPDLAVSSLGTHIIEIPWCFQTQ